MLKVLIVAALLLAGGMLVANYSRSLSAPAPSAASGNAAAPAPQAGDVQVVVDEATMSDRLNRGVAGKPIAESPLGTVVARQVAVKLRDGQVTIDGDAQVGSSSVPVRSTGTVGPQNGRAVVDVQDVRVAGVPLGASQRQQVQQMVQSEVDRVTSQERMQVRSVTVADGKMTVIGRRG